MTIRGLLIIALLSISSALFAGLPLIGRELGMGKSKAEDQEIKEWVEKELKKNPKIIQQLEAAREVVLHAAAQENKPGLITFMLSKGAVVDAVEKQRQYTALHCAAKYGALEAVKVLLDAGADMNRGDNVGTTPLHAAALGNGGTPATRLAVLKEMLSRKDKKGERIANLEAKLKYGHDTVLISALEFGPNKETVKFLIESGTDINAKNQQGQTPFHLAAQQNNAEAIKMMLDKGVKVDVPVTNGSNSPDTALLLAAQKGNVEAAKVLLEAGAKISTHVMAAGEACNNNKMVELLDKYEGKNK